jgi:hypothetical protein
MAHKIFGVRSYNIVYDCNPYLYLIAKYCRLEYRLPDSRNIRLTEMGEKYICEICGTEIEILFHGNDL